MNKKNDSNKKPKLLRGMKDILPEDQPYWHWVRDTIREIGETYGFKRIDTPIMEETNLFVRSIGEETDIVEKEMYSFTSHREKITLRPDGTAPIARAYIEHGMINRPQPIKLYYSGPFFRHDKPQAGRYRQFWQFGFEILGETHPVVDSELILLAHSIYKELGLDITIQVNSIGCSECRDEYVRKLKNYFRPRRSAMCESCRKRLNRNPLRLLDCKEEECQKIAKEAPQIVDHLCEDCKKHFMQVLEYLDDLEISYALNPHLVRGLDYYTRTAFEIWSQDEEKGSQAALGGGGRYNNLVESLGGRPTPAIGFACGIERLIIQLKKNKIQPPQKKQIDVFVAQLGKKARRKCLKLFESLRKKGLKVAESLSKTGLKAQLEVADKKNVKFTLIIGQKEIMDDTVLIRDMENGIQEMVDYDKVYEEVVKRLEKNKANTIKKEKNE